MMLPTPESLTAISGKQQRFTLITFSVPKTGVECNKKFVTFVLLGREIMTS
jgi:hypothetical protein